MEAKRRGVNMSRGWQEDIKELMKLYKQEVREKPGIPNEETVRLRHSLNKEEFLELTKAMGLYEYYNVNHATWQRGFDPKRVDMVGVADGITDCIVVLLGCANAFGINIQPIWDLIHQNNLTKANGPVREDGKRLKGPNWEPPKIMEELLRQGMIDIEKNKPN